MSLVRSNITLWVSFYRGPEIFVNKILRGVTKKIARRAKRGRRCRCWPAGQWIDLSKTFFLVFDAPRAKKILDPHHKPEACGLEVVYRLFFVLRVSAQCPLCLCGSPKTQRGQALRPAPSGLRLRVPRGTLQG